MRRYLGTDEDRRRVAQMVLSEKLGWRKERLIALKMGFSADNTVAQISEVTGRSVPTIQRWFTTYRDRGLEAVLQRGSKEQGRPSALDEEISEFIQKGLRAARWNTAKQAHEQLESHFKRSFYYKTVWRWLKKAAGVLRIPRPIHEKRNPKKAEAFKRNFLGHLRALELPRDKPVKVWFADESRYGLLPNLRRVWTLKGRRPHKKWKSEYQWSYCYGAIDPIEGKTVFVQTPTVNTDWTEAFLEQIKIQYPDHEHVVVWDGAGFHPRETDHAKIPSGIHPILLPPYSPELNPIEKLWDLIQDHTSNHLWPTIERLDEVVAQHLATWWETPERVISLFGKGWIRASVNAS